MDELTAYLALSRLPGLTRIGKRELVDRLPAVGPLFEGALSLPDRGLMRQVESFRGLPGLLRERERLDGLGIRLISLKDESYPPLLKSIPDAPIILYARGPLRAGDRTLAVVGSRRASFEGMNLAEKIGETLSSLSVCVVSGLASGIDASSHLGALKGKGKTIAVLGCGLDICYPAENRLLYERIGREGLLLTEYGPGMPALRHHFPERNRIIAGLSRGVLVVEAAERSGSLITARLGLEYGREVLAVPGSIYHQGHKGANNLIKQGARLVDGIEEIVTACFRDAVAPSKPVVELDEKEEYIYSLIGSELLHVDQVIEKSGMDTKDVMAVLTRMEMKGLVRAAPGGFYLRA